MMDVGKYVVHALLGLVLMIGIGGGVWADREWEARPAFSWLIPAPFRYPLPQSWKTVRWAGGWPAQLAAAQQTERAALGALSVANNRIVTQNAANQRLSQQGQSALTEARNALSASQSEVAHLGKASLTLRGYTPTGPDACSRWDDADRHVLEAFQ